MSDDSMCQPYNNSLKILSILINTIVEKSNEKRSFFFLNANGIHYSETVSV